MSEDDHVYVLGREESPLSPEQRFFVWMLGWTTSRPLWLLGETGVWMYCSSLSAFLTHRAAGSSHKRPEGQSAISYDYSEEELMASIEREYCR